MIYTVKRIEEDLDFGCEERPKGVPVMAIVTLMNSSGEEIRIKAEDAMLYECNINEDTMKALESIQSEKEVSDKMNEFFAENM